ncbi:efflux RND transporter periplasmic adaptor subunit [Wenzhouxiangella sp. XN79A]|uniref:efflux RND transporter periplasmic adaptor subunit n=1 Tax=Wenzhouxiangella sp. XN79A TaxID=2724193 RepID=UPI00144A5878|nr:efflux RND transporter periplasmic adaptor subunit [Wenzhouxiangella sp. XN79A]
MNGLVALSIALLATGCDSGPPNDEADPPPPRPVRVEPAIELPAVDIVRFPGVVRATERASLAFLQSGYLAERRVERGERVAAGQLLAVLHNPALQPGVAAASAAVAEAETRRDQLERDTERLGRLVERELIAPDELEQVRAQRDAAAAALDQARARLDEAVAQLEEAGLRAPFAGRVSELHLEPGDFAAAGQPVLDLADADALEVEIRLPAHRAATLRDPLDRPVRRIDDGRRFGARLTGLGQAAPGRTAPAVLALDADAELVPGDAVDVELAFAAPAGVGVPLAAVLNPGTRVSRVVRVRDGRAEHVAVDVGRLQGRYATVFGDLAVDDPVIVSGHAQLLDGEPVRLLDAGRTE